MYKINKIRFMIHDLRFKKVLENKIHNSRFIIHDSGKEKGFTLIEMVVVIGILSILAVGVLMVLNPVAQFQKANDARRKSDLAQIQRALETYYEDNGQYPLSSNFLIDDKSQGVIQWGASWQPYINILPKDPVAGKNYVYYSTGQVYYIYASLDRGSDPDMCKNMTGNPLHCSSLPVGATCGSGSCDYGVSSPNVAP